MSISNSHQHRREFGLLVEPLSGGFSGGSIITLDDHCDRVKWFEDCSNKDGYYYPHDVAQYKLDPSTMEMLEKIPRSERPASFYHLPPSHILQLESPVDASNTASSDDVLIIYALSYLYGTRLQFADWGLDGRVPFKSNHNFFVQPQTCLEFLGHTYDWWRSKPPSIRKKYINILYVYCRANSFEWEWDAFIHQYMVFDAIFNLHCALRPNEKKNIRHEERFNLLFSRYNIYANDELVKSLYKARNDLFHEALWTGTSMGFGDADSDAYYLPRHLSRLNSRLICGLVNYQNDYLGSIWWAMGTFSFGRRC